MRLGRKTRQRETFLLAALALAAPLPSCSQANDDTPARGTEDAASTPDVATLGSGGSTGGGSTGGGATGGGGGAGGMQGGSAGGTENAGAGGVGGSDARDAGTGTPRDASSRVDGESSDAASPLTLVLPIVRGNTHVLEFGKTTFVVDGTKGARITAFTMDGKNILTGPESNPLYWGSTFWTAPESEWMPNLVVPIDSGPYVMTVGNDSSITAVGSVGNVTAMKQVAVTKHFAADLKRRSIAIEYSMTNKGTSAFQLGHWEVTRVPPGGLTFYPAGQGTPNIVGPIQLQKIGAYNWFDHSTFPKGTAAKSSGDGAGGWVAHVVADPGGDILLIKTFADIPPNTAGTGHGEVEDAAPDLSYVEVEDHNKQVTFAPGMTIPWPVRWYLRRLPAGMMRTPGNQALVDFVLKQIN